MKFYEIMPSMKVKDPAALDAALSAIGVGSGLFVVWSNEQSAILYIERSIARAESAHNCSGDYSSVIVRVR